MAKTKRVRSNRRKTARTHDYACCDVTFTGLNRWYVEKFEKLGWMILAKAHGYNDKILCYKTSLARLKEAIEHKLSHTSDADHKADLKIMWNNVNILIEHVNKDFGI